jgi:hypothetical protein
MAQKEEWQTLNHFGGSSVCLASRRFMRSGYFIVDLIRLHNNADTVDGIRIFLYMRSRAGPAMYEPRVPGLPAEKGYSFCRISLQLRA